MLSLNFIYWYWSCHSFSFGCLSLKPLIMVRTCGLTHFSMPFGYSIINSYRLICLSKKKNMWIRRCFYYKKDLWYRFHWTLSDLLSRTIWRHLPINRHIDKRKSNQPRYIQNLIECVRFPITQSTSISNRIIIIPLYSIFCWKWWNWVKCKCVISLRLIYWFLFFCFIFE